MSKTNTVVISHGNLYKEVTEAEYHETWQNTDGGWALLTDQEFGWAALDFQTKCLAAPDPSQFVADAKAYQAAVEAS